MVSWVILKRDCRSIYSAVYDRVQRVVQRVVPSLVSSLGSCENLATDHAITLPWWRQKTERKGGKYDIKKGNGWRYKWIRSLISQIYFRSGWNLTNDIERRFANAKATTEMHVCTCRRGKKYLSTVPFHPSEWPLLSTPWCSQMPVTSPWKDKREGEPDRFSTAQQIVLIQLHVKCISLLEHLERNDSVY